MRDEATQERRALEAGTLFRSLKVRRALEARLAERGGPGLPPRRRRERARRANAGWGPRRNGPTESFGSRLRAEHLDAEPLHDLADAEPEPAACRRHSNEERPHSSLGRQAPTEGLARFLEPTRAAPSRSPESGASSSSSLGSSSRLSKGADQGSTFLPMRAGGHSATTGQGG